jgi:diacylglycerol kinase
MNAFLKRLQYALAGWCVFFARETNGQIQLVIAIIVIATGFLLQLQPWEWVAVLLCIGAVLGLEMVNTAIEKLADHLHPGRHEQVSIVKDVAAGAVLWAAAISVVVGVIVFGPKLLELF